jgi:hypothetical protein
MQMKNRLAGPGACIDHGAITRFGKPAIVRDPRSDAKKMAEQSFVPLRRVVERFDVLARDDKHVNRRLRINIFEGDAALVAVNHYGRDLAFGDFTEDAGGCGHNEFRM